MKNWLLICCCALFCSCDGFGTKKISSEEIFEAEAKQINWKEVDSYPAFEECKPISEIEKAKICFETMLSNRINENFSGNKIEVEEPIADTLMLYLSISEEGKPEIDSLQVDSLTHEQLPQLRMWLKESVGSLPHIYPATKRGIPVSAVFKLPVIIQSE